jgi:hypothetical protein
MLASTACRSLLRLANCSSRLQQRQQRPSKQCYLLPCNHHRRAIAKPLDIVKDSLPRSKARNLFAKCIRKPLTMNLIQLRSSRSPRPPERIARIPPP